MLEIPTPCHIIDIDALKTNLERVSRFKQMAKCEVYLAVKGFSAPYLFDIMKPFLDGISASGLYEARLGREHFGKSVQTYSPAFQKEQIEEVLSYSDTIVFNSLSQFEKYSCVAKSMNCSCGIRINPLFSQIQKEDANPCRQHSHLGVPISSFPPNIMEEIDGIHMHTMCEQGAESLELLVEYLIKTFGKDLRKLKWINLGGGQMIGNESYDLERAAKCIRNLTQTYGVRVILEPCEGILSECGYFATKVLDIFENDGQIAVLDTSPICHMQDSVFRGWTREILGEVENGFSYLLCGQTCFAGDTFGWYTFERPLQIGEILFFKDTATYTWVKNNAFNGIPFPTICSYDSKSGIRIVKEYGYNEFYSIL